jgi:hypothetical protein
MMTMCSSSVSVPPSTDMNSSEPDDEVGSELEELEEDEEDESESDSD